MQKKIVHLVLFKKRPVAGFLVFCIIFMQMFLLNAKSKYPVKVLNDILTHTGWLEWHQEDNVHIIDLANNERIGTTSLLAPSDDGRIVTNDNVDQKIRQVHQFLSCKYAKVLQEFCDYERGIGPECMKMDNPSELLVCLEDLLETLKKSDSLVIPMQGSLSYLHQLSSRASFEKGVFQILEGYKNYLENIPFDRDSITTGCDETIIFTAAKQLTESIEKEMSEHLERLSKFCSRFCWPIPDDDNAFQNKLSVHAWHVQSISGSDVPDMVVYRLRYHIKGIIQLFLESFDGRFGFKYNMESKMTTLMYDPDLVRRVKRMNKLLGHDGWPALNDLEIIMSQKHWETVQQFLAKVDGKIVTKANVDEKVQRAHHFLTCKYALTLKRWCDYVVLIWKQYSMDLTNSSIDREQVVNILRMSIPLVSRMQDALSHFYRLSPHIKYNTNVSDLLEDFKNYFEFKVFKKKNVLTKFLHKSSDSKIIKKNLNIETGMTDIIQRLIKFYGPNCSLSSRIERNTVSEEIVDFSNLEYHITEEVKQLIVSNYDVFGFPFDTRKFKNKGIVEG